jgi:hypothetical protein
LLAIHPLPRSIFNILKKTIMKRLLLATSVCVGLFAFTKAGASHHQGMLVRDSYNYDDTTHKPKPDSSKMMVFLSDTTHKPKPDSGSMAKN